MECLTRFVVLCMAILISLSLTCHKADATDYNVMDFEAKADGTTDNNQAFANTWAAACQDSSESTVIIPPGNYFLTPIKFKGGCQASSIKVQVDGNLIAPTKDQWGSGVPEGSAWITFGDVSGLTFTGTGEFDGQGSSWWDNRSGSRPKSFAFDNCNDLQLSGISSVNPPKAHISIDGCNRIDVSNLKLTAPQNSPNTDGIDISKGTDNYIHDCTIATGDDCIAVGGGTSGLNITNINCGPGHGISVGSLGRDGKPSTVEDVYVSQCTFTGTTNGARIKTIPGKGSTGYAKRISFRDITLDGAKNPIIIDQEYKRNTLGGEIDYIEVSDITFDGFHGTSISDVAVVLDCTGSVGCTGLTLNNINITSDSGAPLSASCTNAHGSSSEAISPRLDCLAT